MINQQKYLILLQIYAYSPIHRDKVQEVIGFIANPIIKESYKYNITILVRPLYLTMCSTQYTTFREYASTPILVRPLYLTPVFNPCI